MGHPTDWKSYIFQANSTKGNKKKPYELELIEFTFSDKEGPILLLCPGYFQNAYIFDLIPEEQISIARYISKHFKFHIFVLLPNGIGKSDYVRKSNLDDIAIDDIRSAIHLLDISYKKKIYLMGHSTGAICFQAYLSGLSRSSKNNLFDEQISKTRQKNIAGLILLAGNTCMTNDDPNNGLLKTSKWGPKLKFLLKRLGWINARLLTKIISPVSIFGKISVAFSKLWSFLYNVDNISDSAKKAFYAKTLDGTSAPTVLQYSRAVLDGCIRNTSGERYDTKLPLIGIPTVQLAFEDDIMAPPTETKRDSFDKIGSLKKKFYKFDNEGHEDFMLNKDLHKNIKDPLTFILESS